VARAEPEQERQVVYNKEFGYSRKDVLIIIVALIALGVFMYEGLQAAGMSPGMAGNWVQLVIFMGICVGWVSTYLWRVANKVGDHQGVRQVQSMLVEFSTKLPAAAAHRSFQRGTHRCCFSLQHTAPFTGVFKLAVTNAAVRGPDRRSSTC
jgi:hypothetical protein